MDTEVFFAILNSSKESKMEEIKMTQYVDQYFEGIIQNLKATPFTIFVSFALALAFAAGGIVLYRKRSHIRNLRWPGVACTVLGCAGLVSNCIQYCL